MCIYVVQRVKLLLTFFYIW